MSEPGPTKNLIPNYLQVRAHFAKLGLDWDISRRIGSREIFDAYMFWRGRFYLHREADQKIETLAELKLHSRGSLRAARKALLLTTTKAAKNMGISQSAYTQIEQRDRIGDLSIKVLENAANAIGCELICVLRPKNRKLYSEVIWEKLWPRAIQSSGLSAAHPKKLAQAMAYAADLLIKDPKFRRLQGWSRNK